MESECIIFLAYQCVYQPGSSAKFLLGFLYWRYTLVTFLPLWPSTWNKQLDKKIYFDSWLESMAALLWAWGKADIMAAGAHGRLLTSCQGAEWGKGGMKRYTFQSHNPQGLLPLMSSYLLITHSAVNSSTDEVITLMIQSLLNSVTSWGENLHYISLFWVTLHIPTHNKVLLI
jgi:hypothetical protein